MNSSYTKATGETATVEPGQSGRSAFQFRNRRQQAETIVPVGVTAGAPAKFRPRGRVLIAVLMIAACCTGAFTVWDSLFRYQAYGIVTGRIIDVAVPIDGVLESVMVCEGDTVRQDSQLANVVDLEYEQQLARIADELRIAEATLQAEIAKVQWQTQVDDTEMSRSIAELYETTGRLQQEHGTLELIKDQLQRTKKLHEKDASSTQNLSTFTIQETAKEKELEAIKDEVVVLTERAKRAAESPRLGAEQIQPTVARCEMLLNEISRLRARIAQGRLKSPVNGTVLRRYHPAGECIQSHDPLFSVMEESSLEIELFLPQQLSDRYKVGDTIDLRIEPFDQLVPCEVVFIGAEHRRPPENIEVYYRSHVRLLPIRVKPASEFSSDKRLSVGSVAKLPHFGRVL